MKGARRSYSALVPALLAPLFACGGGDPARPNVLVVVWDTVRADHLSCYGYGRPTTPFLERLAAECAVYERAVSPGIWTVPSHASLFTGLPVSGHGASTSYAWLNDEFPTLAESLGEAGYDTYAFSANPHIDREVTNLAQGFQTLEHPWDPAWQSRFERAPRAGNGGLEDPDLDGGHAYWSSAGVAHEALVAWLDERGSERPFFAFLNFMEAHTPRRPSEESRRALLSDDERAVLARMEREQQNLVHWMLTGRRAEEDELAAIAGAYDAALLDLDRATEALVEDLRARGLLENTVLVITSDHGENLGEKGLFDHKFCVYDTLLRVPLLVRYPEAITPRRVAETVSTLDVHATLLGLAGARNTGIGKSLTDREFEAGANRLAVGEMISSMPKKILRAANSDGGVDGRRWSLKFKAITRGGYKLIRASDGTTELYDVSADPAEERDLAAGDRERVLALERSLEAWGTTFPVFDPEAQGLVDKRRKIPEAELMLLRELGYVDGDED